MCSLTIIMQDNIKREMPFWFQISKIGSYLSYMNIYGWVHMSGISLLINSKTLNFGFSKGSCQLNECCVDIFEYQQYRILSLTKMLRVWNVPIIERSDVILSFTHRLGFCIRRGSRTLTVSLAQGSMFIIIWLHFNWCPKHPYGQVLRTIIRVMHILSIRVLPNCNIEK